MSDVTSVGHSAKSKEADDIEKQALPSHPSPSNPSSPPPSSFFSGRWVFAPVDALGDVVVIVDVVVAFVVMPSTGGERSTTRVDETSMSKSPETRGRFIAMNSTRGSGAATPSEGSSLSAAIILRAGP
jgi:hypothetical protein